MIANVYDLIRRIVPSSDFKRLRLMGEAPRWKSDPRRLWEKGAEGTLEIAMNVYQPADAKRWKEEITCARFKNETK
jgi:hypothetical protein